MNTKDFDNIVKSMMDGAQEEVSSSVWAGVQSSLAAKKAAAARIIFFKRAGYATVALAAAVALLLWTGLFSDNNSTLPNISEEAIATVQDELPESFQGPTEKILPFVQEAPSSHYEAGLPAEEPAYRPVPAPEGNTPAPESITVQETVSSSVDEKEEIKEAVAENLPTLEDLLREESQAELKVARRGVRIALGGNLESNGISASTYVPPTRRRLSVPTESTVRENGNTEYSLPVSFGLGIKIPLYKSFSVGTGINYTELRRTFYGQYFQVHSPGVYDSFYADITNTIKYIGVPVNFYYDFPGTGKFAFYTYMGGMVEKGLSNKFRIELPEKDMFHKESMSGAQFSISFGLGIEFKISNRVGFYIDPSLKYYFDCNQPKSIRTQQPWMINMEAGLRFNL